MPTLPRPRGYALMLVALVTSLGACSSSSPVLQPPPVAPPVRPAPPAELMTPPMPGSWSDGVRKLLQEWQQLLTSVKDA